MLNNGCSLIKKTIRIAVEAGKFTSITFTMRREKNKTYFHVLINLFTFALKSLGQNRLCFHKSLTMQFEIVIQQMTCCGKK